MASASGPIPVRTLVILAAATFASSASLRACDPILPEIGAAFGTTPGEAAKVITFFGVPYALAQFTYGFVGDRYGHLQTVAITTALSGLTTLLCAFAGTLDQLILARIAVGLTAAAIISLSMAWLGDVVPYERRQAVLAYFISGQIFGLVLGQALAGVVAEHFGWRSVFIAIAAIFLTTGAALILEIRRIGPASAKPLEQKESAYRRFLGMLKRPWVRIVLVSVSLEGMIFFGAYTFVGSYLRVRFGLSFDLIGLIVAGFGIGGLIYAATASPLLRQIGERGFVLWGGAMVAVAFTVIAVAPTPIAVFPATVLAGYAYYMIHNTLQTNATQMAPEARGMALSTFASCLFLGQSLGVAIAAPFFDHTGGAPLFLAAGALLLAFGIGFRVILARRP